MTDPACCCTCTIVHQSLAHHSTRGVMVECLPALCAVSYAKILVCVGFRSLSSGARALCSCVGVADTPQPGFWCVRVKVCVIVGSVACVRLFVGTSR